MKYTYSTIGCGLERFFVTLSAESEPFVLNLVELPLDERLCSHELCLLKLFAMSDVTFSPICLLSNSFWIEYGILFPVISFWNYMGKISKLMEAQNRILLFFLL